MAEVLSQPCHREDSRSDGLVSTAQQMFLSQPCCSEDSRSHGLVSTAWQRFYLSLVVEKTADQMVWCLQHGRGFISVLL